MSTISIGTNTQLMINAFESLGWECVPILDNYFLAQKELYNPILFHATLTSLNSGIGYEFAENKEVLYSLAEKLNWPIPSTENYVDELSAVVFLEKNKKIVVKPADTDHGYGVTVDIDTIDSLKNAVFVAQKFSKNVLLQKHCEGMDYRFLVIGDSVQAVSRRIPAFVVGDNESTVEELIFSKNKGIKEGASVYGRGLIDLEAVGSYLTKDSLLTKPSLGEIVQVIGPANISRGGESEDVTDEVHAELKQFAVEIAKFLGLGVAGVDFLIHDIHASLDSSGLVLIEINKMPGLLSHDLQLDGTSRGIAKKIVEAIILKEHPGELI